MGFDTEKSFIMAERLKQLREGKGLSHEKLSKALLDQYGVKISPDSLINYEVANAAHTKAYKNQGMRVEYLRCLADFYGVSTDYLLAISDTPSPDVSIQAVTQYTGLSEKTVRELNDLKKHSSPQFDLTSDFNEIFDNADFEFLLFNLRDYRKALTAEAIYDRIWSQFHPDDGVLDYATASKRRIDFNRAIQEVIESRKCDNTVTRFLTGICHLDGVYNNDGNLADILIGAEGFDISELCEQRVRKHLTLIMDDIAASVINQDIEDAFKLCLR